MPLPAKAPTQSGKAARPGYDKLVMRLARYATLRVVRDQCKLQLKACTPDLIPFWTDTVQAALDALAAERKALDDLVPTGDFDWLLTDAG